MLAVIIIRMYGKNLTQTKLSIDELLVTTSC